jgi:hypothetical protein
MRMHSWTICIPSKLINPSGNEEPITCWLLLFIYFYQHLFHSIPSFFFIPSHQHQPPLGFLNPPPTRRVLPARPGGPRGPTPIATTQPQKQSHPLYYTILYTLYTRPGHTTGTGLAGPHPSPPHLPAGATLRPSLLPLLSLFLPPSTFPPVPAPKKLRPPAHPNPHRPASSRSLYNPQFAAAARAPLFVLLVRLPYLRPHKLFGKTFVALKRADFLQVGVVPKHTHSAQFTWSWCTW